MKKKIKKIYTVMFILIILLQIIYKLNIDAQKEDLFIDEVYSYGLMNNEEAFIFKRDDFLNKWHTGKYFYDYLTINEDEVFNISSVFKNQAEDVHPPLYYSLLRVAATFTIGRFTKWTGLILNIIIYVLCAIVLYKLGKNLLRNQFYSILLVIIYGFSLFSMQNTTYIRMYQLLELELLLLMYWHFKNYEKSLTKKELIKLSICVITGILTHYYYILMLVGLYIITMLDYARTKKWKNILKYNVALIISGIISILIFPACISHIFSGYRGKASVNKMFYVDNLQPFFQNIKVYLKIINLNMFNIIEVKYVLALIAFLLIFIIIKKKHFNNKYIYLYFSTITYFLAVVKSAPYGALRYIVAIMVFCLIIIMYALKRGLQAFSKRKKIRAIIAIICTIILSMPILPQKRMLYMYYGNKEKIEKLREYVHIPAIYIYNDVDMTQNNFVSNIQYLSVLDNVYILDSKETVSETCLSPEMDAFCEYESENLEIDLDNILKDVDVSNGILVCSSGIDTESIADYIYRKTKMQKLEEVVSLENIQIFIVK